MREQVQSLFHLDDSIDLPPLARSTWSDALASPKRRDITRETLSQVVSTGKSALPDRLGDINGLGNREVYVIDASYQSESAHYSPVYPGKNETKKVREKRDNPKGHMLMTVYDLRQGIPVNIQTETQSRGEMRVVKESRLLTECLNQKKALYVVDRGFIDARYWEAKFKERAITVITRFKSIMSFTEVEQRTVADISDNQGGSLTRLLS